MSSEMCVKPIGVVFSPFRDVSDNVPIQGAFSPDAEGLVKVYPEYAAGLDDIEGFSHLIVLYGFHKCRGSMLTVRPYMDDREHGVFATRSPHRPNHIGLTVVKLLSREGNCLHVAGVDMVDGTPVLDIKPCVPAFDCATVTETGWMEKYLSGGGKPVSTAVRSGAEWRHGRE